MVQAGFTKFTVEVLGFIGFRVIRSRARLKVLRVRLQGFGFKVEAGFCNPKQP